MNMVFQVLEEEEQNDYEAAVKLLEYGGPETDSEDDEGEQSPSPPKETRKRVRAEETPAAPEVTSTPQPVPERVPSTKDVPGAPRTGDWRFDPPEPVHLTGTIDEEILELLRHAAARSAYRTQQYGSLISYMTEIHKEIGMEDADHIIARIRSLRRSEVKMQILEEQQRVLNATAARMREQLD